MYDAKIEVDSEGLFPTGPEDPQYNDDQHDDH
jgi:hypothetical protein